MLTLKNVSKVVSVKGGEKNLLQEVNLIIRPADFIGISGPNGAGKSILLAILSASDTNYNGEYSVDGIDLTKFTKQQKKELLCHRYGYFAPGTSVCGQKTVLQNLKAYAKQKCKNVSSVVEEFKNLLHEFDIDEDLLSQKFIHLSSGTKNICSLLIIIATKPSIMCLDNPTESLDEITKSRLIDKLVSLNKERETTIIVATNNEDLLNKVKRTFMVNGGKVVEGVRLVKKKPEVVVKKKSSKQSIPKKIIIPAKKEEGNDEVVEVILPVKEPVIDLPTKELLPTIDVDKKLDKKAKEKKAEPKILGEQQQMEIVTSLNTNGAEQSTKKTTPKLPTKEKKTKTGQAKGKTIEQKSDDAIKQVVEDETSSEFLIKPVMNKSQRTKRKLG